MFPGQEEGCFHMGAVRFLILIAAVVQMSPAVFPKNAPCSSEDFLVTVVEQKGNPVLGLQPVNFRARFHRKPLKILSVRQWSGPVRVLFLFDVSASMAGWLPLERRIGMQIIHGASRQTQFALEVFADRIEMSVPFTAAPAYILSKINALDSIARQIPKKERKTAIFDAIGKGLSMFGDGQPGDVICLITDGEQTAGQSLSTRLKRSLLAKGIRVDVLYLIAYDNVTWEYIKELPSFRDIHALAKMSGGISYMLRTRFNWDDRRWSPSTLESALAICPLLNLQFGNGYVVRTHIPTGIRRLEAWKLEVVDRDGKVDHRLAVIHARLSPCQAAP